MMQGKPSVWSVKSDSPHFAKDAKWLQIGDMKQNSMGKNRGETQNYLDW